VRLAVLCLLVAGCAQHSVVMAPDGKNAYLVECGGSRSNCLAQAAELCPAGYRILDQESRTGAFITPGQAGYSPQVWNTYHGEIMVRCRRIDIGAADE